MPRDLGTVQWIETPVPSPRVVRDGPVALSLVIPLRNEADNVAFVCNQVAHAAAAFGRFEVVFVDDGSTDRTAARVAEAAASHAFVRLIAHDVAAGQSAAIHSGVLAARAGMICTLDGDGQNPPAEIHRLLARLDAGGFSPGVGLIAGQRLARRDGWSKRVGSTLANGLRARLLGDGARDTGCGLKLFRRDAFLALPYFDHMHRYLPALFARDGWQVVLVDVAHAPRHAGRSNYGNLQRALVGVHDLVGVAWLMARRKRARGTETDLT